MKTSHLLIGAAVLGAGYLYWQSRQKTTTTTTTTTSSSSGSWFGKAATITQKVATSIAKASELGIDLDQTWS